MHIMRDVDKVIQATEARYNRPKPLVIKAVTDIPSLLHPHVNNESTFGPLSQSEHCYTNLEFNIELQCFLNYSNVFVILEDRLRTE